MSGGLGGLIPGAATGLTAAGTNQATAYVLAYAENVFTTVTSGTGAALQAIPAPNGVSVVVNNQGANALLVYPPSGGTFRGGYALNAPVSVAVGARIGFTCFDPVTAPGVTWNVSDLVTSTASTVARREADRAADVIYVADYGAKGDGVTDDTASIQAAINAAAGKAPVCIPATTGNYIITTLAIPANSHIILDGYVQAKASASGVTLFSITTGASNICIEGRGTIDGNRANTTPAGGHAIAGIQSLNSSNLVFRGLTIKNVFNWPINLTGTWSNGLIENMTMQDSGNSCEFNGATNAWAKNLKISGISDIGWAFYGGNTNCGITNSIVSGCSVDGIGILNDTGQPAVSANIIIANNICYANGAAGIGVRTTTVSGKNTNIIIIGNHCYGNNTGNQPGVGGVLIQHAQYVEVSDNLIHNDGAGAWTVYGIWVSNSTSSYVNIRDNVIYNEGQGGTAGYGISIDGASYISAIGNRIWDDQVTPTMTQALRGTLGVGCSILDNEIGIFPSSSPNGMVLAYDTQFRGNGGSATYFQGATLGHNAPLNISTTADATGGTYTLTFADTTGVEVGMKMVVSGGTAITQDNFVTAVTPTTVTLSLPLISTVFSPALIRFVNSISTAVFKHLNPNVSELRVSEYRFAVGTDWHTASTRLQHRLDDVWNAFLEFDYNGLIGSLAIGSGGPYGGQGNYAIIVDNAGNTTINKGIRYTPRVIAAAGAVTVAGTDTFVIVNKTVGASTAVALPSSPATGSRVFIKDGKGDAAANNITISPAAGTIDGAATVVLSVNYASVGMIYNGTQWNVV